jgi:hypothetical protein
MPGPWPRRPAAREHVPQHNEAIAHFVAGPRSGLAAGERQDLAGSSDHAYLAKIEVGIDGLHAGHDLWHRQTLFEGAGADDRGKLVAVGLNKNNVARVTEEGASATGSDGHARQGDPDLIGSWTVAENGKRHPAGLLGAEGMS